MNRWYRVLAACLMMALLAVPAAALTLGSSQLESVFEPAELQVYPAGVAPEELSLPRRVFGRADGHTGWMDVEWDLSGLDLSSPGRRMLRGTPFWEGVPIDSARAGCPLLLYGEGEEPEELAALDVGFPYQAVNVGDDPAELGIFEERVQCETTRGERFSATIGWEMDALDTGTPGGYDVRGTVELPPCFALPEGAGEPAHVIAVVRPDFVDLSGAVCRGGEVRSLWTWRIPEEERAVVEYAVDDGEWALWEEDPHALERMGLSFSVELLEPHRLHRFRVNCGGRTSNVLEVRREDDHGEAVVHVIEGDRDGTGQNPPEPPALVQPAPPPAEADGEDSPPEREQAEPPVEVVDGERTSLSGARLDRLLADERQTLLFEKDGAAAEVPAGFLASLGLGDDQLLSVELLYPQEGVVEVRVDAAGQEVTQLPETVVRVPYHGGEGGLHCFDEAGNLVCEAGWDPENGVAVFTVTRTGRYTLRRETPTAAPETSGEPRAESGALFAAALLAAGAVWARTRHG